MMTDLMDPFVLGNVYTPNLGWWKGERRNQIGRGRLRK